jgi:hypothetical protein
MKDSTAVLALLKPFQRRTVEYVYRRMYEDSDPAMKFLIADEVGLGKTLVARGIIALAIEKMQGDGRIDRIDVVYVCSNAAIARQNINRLNITGEKDYAMASRLTLLPYHLEKLDSRKLNFVSFTPGTTFEMKSNMGTWQERILIYRMLRSVFPSEGFREMLRCYVSISNWDSYCRETGKEYDAGTAAEFREAVLRDTDLCRRIDLSSIGYLPVRTSHENSLVSLRNGVVAELRQKLARVCISKLEPDLVILDEFQRFKKLLHGEDEAAFLAKSLMDFVDPDSGTHARVLMLSATPYKMYTLSNEDENHYSDFIETLSFLFDSPEKLEAVKSNLDAYRNALIGGYSSSDMSVVQESLRSLLMSVMVRTERVGFTTDRNSMLVEMPVKSELRIADLKQAVGVAVLAGTLAAGNMIEYWKSAPYLLNFMKGYVLKRNFDRMMENPTEEFLSALREYLPYLIDEKSIRDFLPLEPGNPRLRSLIDMTVNQGQWKLLWMPPSLPYYKSGNTYGGEGSVTKSLIFSAWNLVPDAIASICSYESERRMVRSSNKSVEYTELYRAVRQYLRFPVVDGRPSGMSSLLLHYPSPSLAASVDPFQMALDWDKAGEPSLDDILSVVRKKLNPVIEVLDTYAEDSARHDLSWHWAALAKMDIGFKQNVYQWCSRKWGGWKGVGTGSGRDGDGFSEHVDLFASAFSTEFFLGSMPLDLLDIVSEIALGSPAICAARALRRIAPSLSWDDPVLMNAAAVVANGFRSLFNNPDSQLLIKYLHGNDIPLWRATLHYAIEGNLQAVLDEYAHVLKESLGLFDHEDSEVVTAVARSMHESLSLRVSSIAVDQLELDEGKVTKDSFRMRCRFALRFADLISEKDSDIVRAGSVREAFNSPFRPFVLASTSIGQEGLDFHTYCHEVWHWNLPGNPVDLEQREGRVHRYKGHAVRKNIASYFGMPALRQMKPQGIKDPWETLFNMAVENGTDVNGIYPYWIFEDGSDSSKVRRVIPLLPFSREESMLDRLKRSLALYRLAFGQPRQEELLQILGRAESDFEKLRISLQP